MGVILTRSLILYVLVIFAVRLMGKRQLGELQPSELVITILVSNIATLPLEDVNIPVIVGITPILALVCFEVVVSWLNLKSPRIRKITSGSPKIVIKDGKIDPDTMRDLRFSVDDLMMALREKEVFDLDEIQFAIVETTGNISVMKKQEYDTPQRRELGIEAQNGDPPQLIISDGEFKENAAQAIGISLKMVEKVLKQKKFTVDDVLIMTADNRGNCFIADKKGCTYTSQIGGKKNDKS